MPSNFRTYEAQSRLLAAVIASNPSLKLNFKAIALHYGSDATAVSIEHRFRPLKKQAGVIRKAVAEGKDAKDMTSIFHLSDKDIAKHYGESTPQGIEFQFRSIKKDAKAIRDAVDKGQSPLSARKHVPAASSSGVAAATPRKRKVPGSTPASRTATTAGATSATTANAGPAGSPAPPPPKRARSRAAELVFSNEEDEGNSTLASSDDVDYDQLDLTPVSTPTRRTAAPATAAAAAAIGPPSVMTTPGGVIVPITPSTASTTTITTSSTFVPDATPALSIGATPPDNDLSPETADLVFHTAVQQRTQLALQNQQQRQQPPPPPLLFHQHQHQPAQMNQLYYTHSSNIVDNDGDDGGPNNVDDDDDEIFIIDTPSKMPKMEMADTAATMTGALPPLPSHNSNSDFGSWDSLGHSQHQPQQLDGSHGPSPSPSQGQGHFSFDTSGGGSPWTQPDFFPPAAADHMVSFSQSQSFYDNDGAI